MNQKRTICAFVLGIMAFGALPASATSYLTQLELTDKNSDYLRTLSDFSEVQKMSIACIQGLKAVPKDIGKMSKLVELTIDLGDACASATVLPESIGDLQALRRLRIAGYSKEPRFPKSLSRLRDLSFLDLSHDSLSEVPSFIQNLTELTELRIQWNPKLKQLPKFLATLSHLKVLRLDSNDLTDLPEFLTKITELSIVTVAHNCRLTQDKAQLEVLKKRFPRVFFSFVNENACQ